MPFWHMDAAMASLLILQTAVDEGLGACFFGIPPEKVAAVRAEFGIPAAFDPVGAITLGHRAATPGRPAPRAAGGARTSRRSCIVAGGATRTDMAQSIQSRRDAPPTRAEPPSRMRDTPAVVCRGLSWGTFSPRRGETIERETDMIVLGLILLIIGLVASIPILTTIGAILLVVGLVLNLVPIGGTRRRVY